MSGTWEVLPWRERKEEAKVTQEGLKLHFDRDIQCAGVETRDDVGFVFVAELLDDQSAAGILGVA